MVTVRELLQSLPDISVYAGEGGLDKGIQTISFIDAPSSVDWLNGGEVILTTAFLYKENAEMQLKFVQKLIEMGVVALGIKIGRYIEEIPDSILTLAEEKNFTIFRIGFDTVWSEIFAAFYTLQMDRGRRSILNTEIVAFDKLFRSSTWDNEAIRTHFLKCINISAAIVDEKYEILSANSGDNMSELGAIKDYCERLHASNAGGSKPAHFITHTKQRCKLFDHALYSGERLILCAANRDISEAEIEWSIALYTKIREKNKFMQDASTIWKNFIREGLIENSDENLMDYARILNIRGSGNKVLFIISGAMAGAASDEFMRLLRPAIRKKEVIIHAAEMDNGDVIAFYGKSEPDEIFYFTNTLRATLRRVLAQHPETKAYVGEVVIHPEEVKRSYECASSTMEQGLRLFCEDKLIFYQDICAISILQEQQYDFSEIAYLNQTITSFDACKTLETYLESGSIKRAAEHAFIHDNTMRYRIQKIEQLLNADLGQPLARVSLLLKLKLWYLSKKKPCSREGHESEMQ